MVKRIAHVGFACFCVVTLTASVAVGQSERPSENALPDAPSALVSTQTHLVQSNPVQGNLTQWIAPETRRPLLAGVAALPSATAFEETPPARKTSEPLFFKNLSPALINSNSRYRASDSDTLMGRATDAASRIFVTRDESGRRRVNTTYFLRLATSIAAHNAARTYRARSGTAPLGDFGSTVGNDAGMNLLHEFGPAVRKVASNHLPVSVYRIEERIVH